MKKELNFIKKRQSPSNADVTITATKDEQVNLTFRNGAVMVVSKTDYIMVAIWRSLLYFTEASSNEGYKVVKKENPAYRYVSIKSEDLHKWSRRFTGHYALKYDREEKLYYIDGSEKM